MAGFAPWQHTPLHHRSSKPVDQLRLPVTSALLFSLEIGLPMKSFNDNSRYQSLPAVPSSS
ncbi:hypothetical protein COLO4_22619 [Corchorus olitorius]|uniref:Uncharacterized protein n=1 Tax=Corchorus olitorius TaxID=93759 RepID=A0A1R3IL30_9ROSI|nr:hypothetical protein COLO4_22619 [Corchorus olitorius]